MHAADLRPDCCVIIKWCCESGVLGKQWGGRGGSKQGFSRALPPAPGW